MPDSAAFVRPTVDRAAVSLLVVLCAVWGLNQVAIKLANAGVSPFFQGGLRSLGATILLLAWARLRGVPIFVRDAALAPGLVAGLLFGIEFALMYAGLALTTASRSVVFVYTAPFFVAIGGHVFVPGERLNGSKIAGLLAAFAGIGVLFVDGPGFLDATGIGDLLCLLAGGFWGAMTVTVKATALARVAAERTLFYQLAAAGLLLFPAAFLAGEPGLFAATPSVVGALAFQIVVVAFLSYVAWYSLIRRYSASRLSAFTFLTPIMGVFFGWAILGDPIGPSMLVALALTTFGIYLVNRPDG